MVSGSCALAKGAVIVSESLAALNNWRVGTTVTATEWGAFTVVGVYRVPATPGDYWTGALGDLFPTEFALQLASKVEPPVDAMFTDRSTLEQAAGHPQAVISVAQFVDRAVLAPTDLSRLAATGATLSSSDVLIASQASVNTQLDATVASVRASWRTLRIAVLLVTAQTLLLVWLLLFLSVTDAVEARGRDCALAKLRGYPRWRLLVVALSESVTLLALAWPVGVGLAWAASRSVEQPALAARHRGRRAGRGVGCRRRRHHRRAGRGRHCRPSRAAAPDRRAVAIDGWRAGASQLGVRRGGPHHRRCRPGRAGRAVRRSPVRPSRRRWC